MSHAGLIVTFLWIAKFKYSYLEKTLSRSWNRNFLDQLNSKAENFKTPSWARWGPSFATIFLLRKTSPQSNLCTAISSTLQQQSRVRVKLMGLVGLRQVYYVKCTVCQVFYRASHVLEDLGWVDLDLGCSTILLGQ